MKVGAEPKKVILLAGLGLVAAYLIISNSIGGGETGAVRHPVQQATPPVRPQPDTVRQAVRTRTTRGGMAAGRWRQFRPSLKPREAQDRLDPMTIDPTLRLDLLAKLQQVKLGRVTRSLFDFSAAPPPQAPEPKIPPKQLAKIKLQQKLAAAQAAIQKKAAKPTFPPINLKFYGYIRPVRSSRKRAFFLDGKNIFVAGEGDLVGKHYKVVRIGVNSVVVEDTRGQRRRTLRLEKQKG